MFLSMTNCLSYFMIFFSMILCISSDNWLFMWMSMEINMMSFIPLMYNFSHESSSSMMKYFLIQTIMSNIFFFSMTIFMMKNFNQTLLTITSLSLMTKMGMAPFFFWLPPLIEHLPWMSIFFLLTIQKIIPLHIFSNINIMKNTLIMFIFMNLFMGSTLIFFVNSMRKILTYSSMTHLSWILSNMITETNWISYLIAYTFMTLTGILIFSHYNIMTLQQMPFTNINFKINLFIFILSNMGFPPFLGFYLKWMTLSNWNLNFLTNFMLILSSFTNMYFYMRCCFPLIMLQTKYSHSKQKMSSQYIMINIIINSWPLIM
uniref:NADH-ubiquinone oxidoreductase chain 2 n=1 Tax=Macrocheles muscaedomesticae TaxID=406086 RepID=A0A6B9WHD0_9ACAR|nr:NADH dehydrogenase subunit 2 [Macrocheles muscaedomesticae]QHQ98535.1 NADH dehydrogenase subunit 2 [Macrocheles muscaedomesticae]